jgi:sarcosine oxidase subunit beta
MTRKSYDVIVIGAGSVGTPTAYFLAKKGASVLCVEKLPSPGQGQNKAAIGGVRATHSDPAKIQICLRSLEIFAGWEEEHGEDIGWKKGGYCFPVYREKEEKLLKGILGIQKSHGLDIDWQGPERIAEVVPGIVCESLRGGTFSPGDGQVSPLLAARAFHAACRRLGVTFRFREPVTEIDVKGGRVRGVAAGGERWEAGQVLIASGADARDTGRLAGLEIPVTPDSHEGGVTAAVRPFLGPLLVDLRPGPEGRTANFYFGQNKHGALIFCYTPIEKILGTDRRATSEFMPVVARRMVGLIPRLGNLLVRRVWRGLYPMTPDGIAIAGAVPEVEGLYLGVGMCGQGFMMGPGLGANLAALMLDGTPEIDAGIFGSLRFDRNFEAGGEALK